MEHMRLTLSERTGSQSCLCPLSSSHFNLFKTQLFLLVKKRGHNILACGCLEYVMHYKIQCLYIYRNCISSVQLLSRVQLCNPVNRSTPGLPVHHHLLEFTQTHVHWGGDAIQPSHPLSSPSPPAPDPSQHQSFPMSQLFAWGGQSTGVSALAVLPKNTQDWSPSEWTGWISLEAKGLSRVFSNTTVQKHQFLSAQLSSQSNSHIHTWLLENHSLD